MEKTLGLYLHIPFCVRKCRYCDFLSFPAGESMRKQYLSALRREIRAAAEEFAGRPVDTVFIGGGTPSILPAGSLRHVLEETGRAFAVLPGAEITVEMNPGVPWKEEEIRGIPYVNRWSVGLQSVHDSELASLGRIHRFHDFEETYRNLRGAGAENVSVDLMFGIPGQTLDSWEETLRTVISFSPEHISAYSLIVEEGTPFFDDYEAGRLSLPDEETERAMAHRAVEILAEAGYRQYEISNFAKPGYESRHNSRYWKRQDYLGLGPGASSMAGNVRWRNTPELAEYLAIFGQDGGEVKESIRRDEEILSKEAQMEEFLFLGLRMTDGVSLVEFEQQFGRTIMEEYGDVIRKYEGAGLLRITGQDGTGSPGQRLCLTAAGMDVSNLIFADFLHDA